MNVSFIDRIKSSSTKTKGFVIGLLFGAASAFLATDFAAGFPGSAAIGIFALPLILLMLPLEYFRIIPDGWEVPSYMVVNAIGYGFIGLVIGAVVNATRNRKKSR